MPELSGKVTIEMPGVETLAGTVDKVAGATTAGAGALLSRLLLPGAEEAGLLVRDKFKGWRLKNLIAFERKVGHQLEDGRPFDGRHAPPRIVHTIVEAASLVEEDEVQEMWAGLLLGSCDDEGDNQGNLIFIDLLRRMSPAQCWIVNNLGEVAIGRMAHIGPAALGRRMPMSVVRAGTKVADNGAISAEIDHAISMGILNLSSKISQGGSSAELVLNSLGIKLYVRSQGYIGEVADFAVHRADEPRGTYDDAIMPEDAITQEGVAHAW